LYIIPDADVLFLVILLVDSYWCEVRLGLLDSLMIPDTFWREADRCCIKKMV
jgi:hypothetical protein